MSAPTFHLSNTAGPRDGGPGGALHLTVMAPNVFATFPLPPTGSVTIGRAEASEVRITDESASRVHARLHLGPAAQLFIEDLGTSNGTFVHDDRIEPGKRIALQLGEAVTIGYTILMVQRRRPAAQPRRIRSHGVFEERLDEACDRGAETGARLAILRVRFEDDEPAGRGAELIAPGLRQGDFLAQYAPGDYEVLLLDTEAQRAHGLADELGRRLRADGVEAKVVVATYPGDGRTAEALIGRATALLRGEYGKNIQEPIHKSEAMRRLYHLAGRASTGQTAAGLINILILGETGVGKEVLADWIRRNSPRADGPFVCINCAALTESLLESELFGHEKGAFTGADSAKAGLLESAAGGTVFLDEIGDMPVGLQTRLLRALENREVTRVGGLKARAIDVRFVAATNKDLEAEVAAKTFRSDLYFRLNGMSLTIPPLRERLEEVEPLARQFLAEACHAAKRRSPRLGAEALEILRGCSWPGNIRELRNVIERALLFCDGAEVTAEHLPVEKLRLSRLVPPPTAGAADRGLDQSGSYSLRASASGPYAAGRGTPAVGVRVVGRAAAATPAGLALSEREQAERQNIIQVLDDCAGSQTKAARRLGFSRGTLIARLKRYEIPRPRASRSASGD